MTEEEFEHAVRALDVDGDDKVRVQELFDIVERIEESHDEKGRGETEAIEKAKQRRASGDTDAMNEVVEQQVDKGLFVCRHFTCISTEIQQLSNW